MEVQGNHPDPVLLHVEPILAVQDIPATIAHWREVLGFADSWTWGEPPSHAGVSLHGVHVQFSQQPGLASVSEGHSLWIRVRRLEALYRLHRENKADIIFPLENKPWGMAEYTVREINGYHLRFAAPVSDRESRGATLPQTISIVERAPTAEEYRRLVSAVGWSSFVNESMTDVILAAVVKAVVAEDAEDGEAIGCALLLGDQASFYYVKDVMVHPDWQGRRVGTAMMLQLSRWLENHAPDNALVGLFTGEHLIPFYRQFGFTETFGMIRRIRRE